MNFVLVSQNFLVDPEVCKPVPLSIKNPCFINFTLLLSIPVSPLECSG
jgi:hypothetical protein